MGEVFRCRKCRETVFFPDDLVDGQREACLSESQNDSSQWYLNYETGPEWIQEAVLKGRYTRGKLLCPKCSSRIGTFDFVGKAEHHKLGPVWVQKCRVDFIKHIDIPSVSCHPQLNLAIIDREMDFAGDLNETKETNMAVCENAMNGETQIQSNDLNDSIEEIQTNDLNNSVEEIQNNDLNTFAVDVNPYGILADMLNVDTSAHSHGPSEQDNSQMPQLDTDKMETEAVGYISSATEPAMQKKHTAQEKVISPSETDPLLDPENAVFTCPICLELLYQAHTCRPCLHVYCAPCLRRLCGATPIHTRCPLCREVIATCLPNHEMTNHVKKNFPEQYRQRRSCEKKVRAKLPPLPSSKNFSFPLTRFNRDRNRNYILVHWAGVCFVVLLCVMIVSVLVTTIGMILWYLWETFMDYFIDGLVSVNGYFDYSWQLIIMILMEKSDEISPELAKMLLGSFGQVLHAVGKLFNKTIENAKDLSQTIDLSGGGGGGASVNSDNGAGHSSKQNSNEYYTVSAFQVDLANYVLIMGFVTYLIYRFARYRQARLVEGA